MAETAAAPVHLLAEDPDLGRGLDPQRARDAQGRLLVRALDVPRGRWVPSTLSSNANTPIGLLVLDGLLVREAAVGSHPSAELLGPGDLIRGAWDDADGDMLLPRTFEWSALTSSRVAVIDHAFVLRAAQWPEVFAALIERAGRRADRLQVMQAISHLTRVDDRLLALMWILAERWGRVVPEGILVSVRLPHRILAAMVGARRPSVTTALGQLMSQGVLLRRPDGGFVLTGEAPEVVEDDGTGALPFARRSA